MRIRGQPRLDQGGGARLGLGRPGWLSAGGLRLLFLCLFIVLIGMVRPRLTQSSAGVLLIVGGVAVLAGALVFLVATRHLAMRLPVLAGSKRVVEAVLVLIRRTGLPLLGFAFFVFWTFVYLGLWWFNPNAAFAGLAERPRFADFFYYAVLTAFTSPPEDIVAHTRGARSATMIEMLTGLALFAAYVSSFVDWRREGGGQPRGQAGEGRPDGEPPVDETRPPP